MFGFDDWLSDPNGIDFSPDSDSSNNSNSGSLYAKVLVGKFEGDMNGVAVCDCSSL